jgi:hypothetical protein
MQDVSHSFKFRWWTANRFSFRKEGNMCNSECWHMTDAFDNPLLCFRSFLRIQFWRGSYLNFIISQSIHWIPELDPWQGLDFSHRHHFQSSSKAHPVRLRVKGVDHSSACTAETYCEWSFTTVLLSTYRLWFGAWKQETGLRTGFTEAKWKLQDQWMYVCIYVCM